MSDDSAKKKKKKKKESKSDEDKKSDDEMIIELKKAAEDLIKQAAALEARKASGKFNEPMKTTGATILMKEYQHEYVETLNCMTTTQVMDVLPANWNKELRKMLNDKAYEHRSFQAWQTFFQKLTTVMANYHELLPLIAVADPRVDVSNVDDTVLASIQNRLYTGIYSLCGDATQKLLHREVPMGLNRGTNAIRFLDSIEFNSSGDAPSILKKMADKPLKSHSIVLASVQTAPEERKTAWEPNQEGT